jgi:type II secretory pathway pseudopilin PulG
LWFFGWLKSVLKSAIFSANRGKSAVANQLLKGVQRQHMKIRVSIMSRLQRKLAAFSLMEVAVGMGILGTAVGALFSGFTTGFFTIRMARENLRATQIMLEKVETIRLYSWHQVTNGGFIPVTFTNKYDPVTQHGNSGLLYYGTVNVTNVNPAEMSGMSGVSPSYTNNLRLVTVKLAWKTGNLQRNREFKSYISRFGLQDYVY